MILIYVGFYKYLFNSHLKFSEFSHWLEFCLWPNASREAYLPYLKLFLLYMTTFGNLSPEGESLRHH